MTPHVQKDDPFAVSFTRCALNHFVNDNELSDVSVSLFSVQLRAALISLPYVFLDTAFVVLKDLFCKESL